MADDTLRTVTIERIGFARFRAHNVRGGTFEFGEGGDGTDFGAVELLLVALAGCSAADVDYITNRRAEPESFAVEARGHKVKDDRGNRMADLPLVGVRVRLPRPARTATPPGRCSRWRCSVRTTGCAR